MMLVIVVVAAAVCCCCCDSVMMLMMNYCKPTTHITMLVGVCSKRNKWFKCYKIYGAFSNV